MELILLVTTTEVTEDLKKQVLDGLTKKSREESLN